MHDIVAHSVSVMIALSDGAGAALDRAPDRSREALLELSRTGRAALADMQRVLGVFDPPEEDASRAEPTAPTETDLRTIVDRYRAAGLPLTATGLDVALPADTSVRLALVRIVSEALTNVLRHAPGTGSVEVVVRRSASLVEVEVLDEGGTRPVEGGGTGRGVPGMRERAALLGGRVDVGPRTGGGWRMHVVLPCDDEHDEHDDHGGGA
jgi:signal transduction histidine kinase